MHRKTFRLSIAASFMISTSAVLAADRLVPSVYPTIQAGIDAADDNDTIIVAQGTHYENIDFGGKSIAVTSTDPNDPNVVAATVIDANGSGTVVTFPDAPDANCVLAGFTITDGNVPGNGGGILCWNGAITINNCIITGNSASEDGGGIYNDRAELTVTNCIITGNSASDGGGIYSDRAELTVTNCIITGNSSTDGGGIYNYRAELTVTGCTFNENVVHTFGHGGGVYSRYGELTLTDCAFNSNSGAKEGGGVATDYNSATVTNCTFTGNSADWGGGMNNSHWGATATNCIFTGNSAKKGGGICSFDLSYDDQTLRLSNCTFNGNVADDYGGAVCYQHSGNLMLTDCIAWGNSANEGPQIALLENGTVFASYSCLQGAQLDIYTGPGSAVNWLSGNIAADPCFADQAGGDCHLQSTAGRWDANTSGWVIDGNNSPCIDAGNPGCSPANEPAPNGNRINMGGYGRTAEASKSPPGWAVLADLTNDHKVDEKDLRVFVDYWLEAGQCIPADLSHDQSANFLDFAIFVDNWHWEQ